MPSNAPTIIQAHIYESDEASDEATVTTTFYGREVEVIRGEYIKFTCDECDQWFGVYADFIQGRDHLDEIATCNKCLVRLTPKEMI